MEVTAGNAHWFADSFTRITDNVGQALLGKEEVIRLALTCMFAEGHLLLEDAPGTGKTALARAIAATVHGTHSRIQFTPDLLPSDITGVTIYDQRTGSWDFHKGPIFASIVLADEINRASPKTQSALLEVMEEAQVTVDGVRRETGRPFMVIATQNLVTKTGKPWGKFTLEDYNGTHEFALFSKDYENFRKYLFNDYFLFIRGKVQPKPYNDKELEFKITSMVQLSEMRDTMIKEMYIQLAIEDITREMIEELTHRIKESEGSTTLRVNVYDRDAQVSVNMFSKRHKVSLTSNLVSFLEDNEIKYTIV